MAKNKTKTDGKVSDKKLNRLLIEKRLEETLADLKSWVGKKKFEQGIKQAGKLLTKDFPKKSLDNFRKKNQPLPEEDIKEETTMLIEELP